MQKLNASFTVSEVSVGLAELSRYSEGWLLSGDIDQQSERTLITRRDIIAKLLWFLKRRQRDTCGLHALRQFFAYCANGHKEPGGRWDRRPWKSRCACPVLRRRNGLRKPGWKWPRRTK